MSERAKGHSLHPLGSHTKSEVLTELTGQSHLNAVGSRDSQAQASLLSLDRKHMGASIPSYIHASLFGLFWLLLLIGMRSSDEICKTPGIQGV